MDNLTPELLKTLAGGGPLAIAVYFLGKNLLKAWEEDRAQLRTTNAEVLAFLRALTPILQRLDKESK